jgi:RAB protein geranylgeranyltransferase component A
VPGSKEDVFKDRTIGLREKRSLMKVLLWIAGEFEGSAELASGASAQLVDLVYRC